MDKSPREVASKMIEDLIVVENKIKAAVKVSREDLHKLQKSINQAFGKHADVKESVIAEKKGKVKTVDQKDAGKERKITITADEVGRPKETPEARRERIQTQKKGGVHKNDASRNRRKDKQDIRSGNYDIARRGN